MVYRSGKPVAASEWPSRKARDILKILAARGASGIRRDEIADMLWPDDDDPGSKLSVALSHLKRVLDPDKQYDASHFIVADRASIRLDVDNTSIDVVEFRVRPPSRSPRTRPRILVPSRCSRPRPRCTPATSSPTTSMRTGPPRPATRSRCSAAMSYECSPSLSPRPAIHNVPSPGLPDCCTYDPHDEPTYEALIWVLVEARRHGEARRYHRMYEMRMRELDVPAQSLEDMTG